MIEAEGKKYGFHSVGQGGLKIWREAFRAIEFARAVGSTKLRMQDAPDAVFSVDGQDVYVELTDARSDNALKNEDWSRFAKLNELAAKIPSQQYDPTDECLTVSTKVLNAIEGKIGKPYSHYSVLAVHAECFWFDSLEQQMTASIEKVMAEHQSHFADIWVLAGGRFFRSKRANPQ